MMHKKRRFAANREKSIMSAIMCQMVGFAYLCAVGGAQQGDAPPLSPCPFIFRYQQDLEGWHGLLKTPSPMVGGVARLQLKMSLGASLPSKYPGRIEVLTPRAQILATGGRDPVTYKVLFPVPWPLPQVTGISMNGATICTGPPVRAPVFTNIALEHTLFTQDIGPILQPHQPELEDFEVVHQVAPRPVTQPQPPPRPTTTTTSTTALPHLDDLDIRLEAVECGTTVEPVPLIANGSPVEEGAFPWLTALFLQKSLGLEFFCSGNLVSERHVLTAAHCLINRATKRPHPAEKIVVVLGRHNLLKWSEKSITVEADDLVVHPDFDSAQAGSDIAVIRLYKRVQFTARIRPVCLWAGGDALGRRGAVLGWGKDEKGNRISPEPRMVSMPIVSEQECVRSKPDFVFYTNNGTFCAGDRDGSGPCNGDSGSGFLLKQANRWYLKGLVSLSLRDQDTGGCDLAEYIVFTNVPKFSPWLNKVLAK